MLFNSLLFSVFFPILVFLYRIVPKSYRWLLLLVASCYFYMCFVPSYILVLGVLILIDFFMAKKIEQAPIGEKKRYLAVSLCANLGILFFFKYFNFVNANVAWLASRIHWNYSIEALRLLLPLGLSFHIFQSLSYIFEVYRGRYPAEKHFGMYSLYILFFPQLVAGPIERPQELLPQLKDLKDFNRRNVSTGLRQMLWGFFKKIVIADRLAVLVTAIFNNAGSLLGPIIVGGIIAFAFQLYADFSGYSDIAMGTAKVFGIDLVNNFQYPYFSASIAEFWRRWHISLSSWFRDYVYSPFAFYLRTKTRYYIGLSLIATFVLIGLWHGAGWTYVCMGLLHGLYLTVGSATKKWREKIVRAIGLSRLPRFHKALQVCITFSLVSASWVFFRAESISKAFLILSRSFSGWHDWLFHRSLSQMLKMPDMPVFAKESFGMNKTQMAYAAASIGVLILVEWISRFTAVDFDRLDPRFRFILAYCLLVWILAFGFFLPQSFIYFKF
jgi:alginate O-acetyltransferase complex protein AlgI